jgi:plastocyanin
MSRHIPTVLACIVLAAGLVAGCGDDEEDTSGQQQAPAQTSTTGGGGTVEVRIKNVKFVPEQVTAKVGQKILWTNDDGFAHNVTATEGADFASKRLEEGDTFEFAPTKAGTIDYVCTIHPGQNGSITVE